MEVKILNDEYKKLKKLEDSDDGIFEFKKKLLDSDDEDVLNFHFGLLKDKENENIYRDVFSFFSLRNNKEKTGEFLFKKYKSGIEDLALKADVIQILGHLRNKHAKEAALDNIKINKGDLRYRSIIVLGWVGNQEDIEILNERLLNDKDEQLRCYAATAMRQIWFSHPNTKEKILKCLKQAISLEKNEKALEGIIITTQELLKKKLGLKESKYGDVSGDIIVAKAKTTTALEKY